MDNKNETQETSQPVQDEPKTVDVIKPIAQPLAVPKAYATEDYTNKGGEKPVPEENEQYVVQEGDTLFSIAQAKNVGLQQLRYFNHLSPTAPKIRPKMTLSIPAKPVYVPVGK